MREKADVTHEMGRCAALVGTLRMTNLVRTAATTRCMPEIDRGQPEADWRTH
jgi:hypothetical protein